MVENKDGMKSGKKQYIVIIDDGIYDNCGLKLPFIAERWKVQEGIIVKDSEDGRQVTHGALCAAVMERIYQGSSIISMKILDADNKGNVRDLILALKWCLERRIPLIHMSIGTSVYDQTDGLRECVECLAESGVFMIASFHNRNIPTWPACFPRVFGVRSGRGKILSDREIAFDDSYPGNRENSIVACINESLGKYIEPIAFANSFAAPVITARLAEMLSLRPDLIFSEALDELEMMARKCSGDAFEKLYCYYGSSLEIEVSTPVLWLDQSIVNEIVGYFERDGYEITLFTDFGEGIPLALYCQEGLPEYGFLQMTEEIYRPDVILLSTVKNIKKDFGRIDVYVENNTGEYEVIGKMGSVLCDKPTEVFSRICALFSRE